MALNDLPSRAWSSGTLVRGAAFMMSQVKDEHDDDSHLDEEYKVLEILHQVLVEDANVHNNVN